MGISNAKDSFADLLEVRESNSRQQQVRPSVNNGGVRQESNKKDTSFRLRKSPGGGVGEGVGSPTLGGGGGGVMNAKDSLPDLLRMQQAANAQTNDPRYKPAEVSKEHDEAEWPIWEMTELSSWQRGAPKSIPCVVPSRSLPLSECERIFTVPEVYEGLQATSKHPSTMALRYPDDEEETCGEECNIFSCLAPWARTPQFPGAENFGARQPLLSPGRERQKQIVTSEESALELSSKAVHLYHSMPSLTRRSFAPSMFKVSTDSAKGRNAIMTGDNRRLFIEGEGERLDREPPEDKKKYRVHFSELKRVLRVRKFTPEEASAVWFGRYDFEHFKAEMTLLIQEDECQRELAEAWLATTEGLKDSLGRQPSTNSEDEDNEEEKKDGVDDAADDKSYEKSIKKTDSDLSSGSTGSSSKPKWWHQYEHSRRGLERYASPGQALQIVASHKVALRKVLGEQNMQRLLNFLCVPGALNPDKIAEIYHEYTAWSRDLALAAGASDADAVRTNFDDEKRHTREYYMLKQVVASDYRVHRHMPQFMMPNCITPKGYLNEAETLYFENRKKMTKSGSTGSIASSKSKLGSLRIRSESLTGEEARAEMSRVDRDTLAGPLAPSLVPALQPASRLAKQAAESKSSSNARLKYKSNNRLGDKAKNYPFQKL
mmetsp:Transcript_34871/g.78576  ORF Transcript_34871/g.78576 Transcript_34871/m.78576 type:complete len:658 (+) Transcript_34871:351-2324(+)